MDAGDAETYAVVRPPHRGGPPRDPAEVVGRTRSATCRPRSTLRKQLTAPTRIVVSIIRQEQIEGKLDAAIDFWMKEVGVDEVITRKFLSWDDNTHIQLGKALDPHLYKSLPTAEDRAVRVAVRAAERRHARPHRAVRAGHLVPDRGALSQRQRRLDQGDLAGRAVQLVPAAAPRGPRRRSVPVPRLFGLVCRHPRLGSRLAEGAEDLGRPPRKK